MKQCNICKETKELTEYHKNSYLKSGYANRCKVCQKGYTNKSNNKASVKLATKKRRANNQALISRYKTACGCSICGYNKHPFALDFDHLDPSTKRGAGYAAVCSSWSRKRLKEEIRKCRVVCANCHRLITHGLL